MDLERFAARYPFPLDDFQRQAISALAAGESVLVAAPTGSGKTLVAEFAVEQALGRRRKAFYTTPLKALSNQKFGDFVARYGPDRVGLLTGDNSINGEAPVVVMTTEVLRNMLYERSGTLEGLDVVVMDEVHYLQDPYRGAVWEEILIHLPLTVAVVALSATVSNAEEFGEWLTTLRGTTRVIIEERRPVPLEQHYMVGRRLYPMHVERGGRPVPNPSLLSLTQRDVRGPREVRGQQRGRGRGAGRRDGGRPPRQGPGRVYAPRREDVVDVLDEAGMLPAIYFVFSRAGCDRSVEYLMAAGVRLTDAAEEAQIRERADLRAAWIEEDDLAALGYGAFREALAAGIAAHHAGMVPAFKETVEELFAEGLVKVVFATETLSLGINMPARTVVIESLWKFSGERHELLTPGEFTQLTGRAGRRGIDELGHAVVLYQKELEFEKVSGLATRRTYELRSSFRPSYNMAVNLVRNYTPEEARHLLNSSFAQFQADRGVVALERQLERDRAFIDGYRARIACHLGDFAEYWALRERAEDIRRRTSRAHDRSRREAIKDALASLRPGEVIHVPTSSRRGLAVVLASRDGRPTLLTQDRKFFRASVGHFDEPPEPLSSLRLPRSGSARSARYRRDVAAQLVNLRVSPPRRRRAGPSQGALAEAEALEREAARHPSHACPDRGEHERWAARASRLEREVRSLERRIRSRTETLARQFDRVLRVLQRLGYIEGFRLTGRGELLLRIYGEADILVAEAVAQGLFQALSAAEMAALASTMVYESRERVPRRGELPTSAVAERFAGLRQLWGQIRAVEEQHQVELCRDLESGFAASAFQWAEGKALEDVLYETEMAPGDFVRTCKQLIDLLRQIEDVAEGTTAALAAAARGAVNRGVVAYTGV
ncbi:MAG TPA: DEAD/DEAH box helicase [Actinomycetota bacterium]|nr:DEAD/DEAH box helicase [Actinomycetota bacterium]